jgi:hypothetical protein
MINSLKLIKENDDIDEIERIKKRERNVKLDILDVDWLIDYLQRDVRERERHIGSTSETSQVVIKRMKKIIDILNNVPEDLN